MRWSRERKRDGRRCLTIEIFDHEVDALIQRGYLATEDREDIGAVVEALHSFLGNSLA
jgi:hypothetical protein